MLAGSLLLLSYGALVPPSLHLSRRQIIVGAPVAATVSLIPGGASASIEAKEAALAKARAREEAEAAVTEGRDQDPLKRKLQKSRDDLLACAPLLEAKQWDAVRKTIGNILPVMTFRGYTGESVKARADAWTAAGNTQLAKEIRDRRQAFVVELSALDNAIFAAQTSDKKKMLTADQLQQTLSGSVVALDSLLEKIYCQLKEDGTERRWRSGACEILPLAPNLRDLAY